MKAATPPQKARTRRGSPRRPRPSPTPKPAAAPSPERILQLAWGYAPTLILETALNYRVFDLLDEAPQTVEELSARSGTSSRGLRAILNALVGLEFLKRKGERYELTPESAAFLVSKRPDYYGTYFTHMTRQLLPRWTHLAEAVRSGRPVVMSNPEERGPAFFSEFVESLFPLNYRPAQVLGQHLGVPQATGPLSVLDIGAGSGVWGIALAHQSRHVTIRAVDWPEVLEVTRRVALRQGVAERLLCAPGDLLEADFGRDHSVAILGHILHSESPERSIRLLAKTYAALAPGATVVISEFMPNPERTSPANALIFAVNMLVNTELGDTFTFPEMSDWLRQAGFERPRLLEAPAPSPLILANRPQV